MSTITVAWPSVPGAISYDLYKNGAKVSSTKVTSARFSVLPADVIKIVAVTAAPPPVTSYAQATAGIVLPVFNQTTATITCRSQADIDTQIAALNTLPPTEYRKIVVAPGVVYNGELFWSVNLPGGPGLQDPHVFWDWGPSFRLNGGLSPAGFYSPNFTNVLMAGGDFTCAGGPGIFIAKGHGFQWVGFTAHDGNADGLDLIPGYGDIGPFVMKGTLTHNGLVISGDPHQEKGTGIHACNSADGGHNLGDPSVRSTLALQIFQQPTGAGVELGMEGNAIQNLDLYLYADTIGLPLSQPSNPGPTWLGYAQSQVAGNLLQLWGNTSFQSVVVKYAEGHNLQGRIIDTNGVETANIGGVTVAYARAYSCCLSAPKPNSSLGRQPQPTNPYDPRHGVTYVDCK